MEDRRGSKAGDEPWKLSRWLPMYCSEKERAGCSLFFKRACTIYPNAARMTTTTTTTTAIMVVWDPPVVELAEPPLLAPAAATGAAVGLADGCVVGKKMACARRLPHLEPEGAACIA